MGRLVFSGNGGDVVTHAEVCSPCFAPLKLSMQYSTTERNVRTAIGVGVYTPIVLTFPSRVVSIGVRLFAGMLSGQTALIWIPGRAISTRVSRRRVSRGGG